MRRRALGDESGRRARFRARSGGRAACQRSRHADRRLQCHRTRVPCTRSRELIEGAGGRFLDASIIGPPPRGKRDHESLRFRARRRRSRSACRAAGRRAGDQRTHRRRERAQDVLRRPQQGHAGAVAGSPDRGATPRCRRPARAAAAGSPAPICTTGRCVSFRRCRSKAYRWAPEMVEISKTLETAGITPKVFEGAAEIYRFVAGYRARTGDAREPRQGAQRQGRRAPAGGAQTQPLIIEWLFAPPQAALGSAVKDLDPTEPIFQSATVRGEPDRAQPRCRGPSSSRCSSSGSAAQSRTASCGGRLRGSLAAPGTSGEG